MGTMPERGDEAAWQDKKDMERFLVKKNETIVFFASIHNRV
jgi:hypothetical protein